MSDSCEPLNPEPASSDSTGTATALALEFPDWSGHQAPPPSVTAEEMHRYNEGLLSYATAIPGFEERRLAEKVRVEFVL